MLLGIAIGAPATEGGRANKHSERGGLTVVPGTAEEIQFKRAFDYPCKAYFNPMGSPLFVKEVLL